MNRFSRTRLATAALAAVFALASAGIVGCTHDAAAPGGASGPAASPAANANAPVATAPQPPPNAGDVKPPLGMGDTIEGRVIGLVCYKQNPKASAAELKACSKANADVGGGLGILGDDGTVYVDAHPDARVTNAKLKYFIGEEVTVQGQTIGDAPNLDFDGVKVVKFDMKLARRKGATPPDAKQTMPPRPPTTSGAPAKKG